MIENRYCFHSVLVPESAPIQELSDEQFFKEAQPKEFGEAKLKDAVLTLRELPEPAGFRRLNPPRRHVSGPMNDR